MDNGWINESISSYSPKLMFLKKKSQWYDTVSLHRFWGNLESVLFLLGGQCSSLNENVDCR